MKESVYSWTLWTFKNSKSVKTIQHQNDTRFLKIFQWFIKHTQDSFWEEVLFVSFHPFFSHQPWAAIAALIILSFSSTWPRAPHDSVGRGNVPPIVAMPWQLAAHLVESQAPGILGASGWEKPWGTWEDLHTLLDFQNTFVIFSSNITYPCVSRVLIMTFFPPGRSHGPDPGDQYHRPQRPQAHWPQRHHTHLGKTSRPHGRWPSRSQGACRPTWTNVELCTEKMASPSWTFHVHQINEVNCFNGGECGTSSWRNLHKRERSSWRILIKHMQVGNIFG